MKLNTVNVGMNKYCGPAVLSILTGKSTDDCARIISSINGKYTIEGVKLPDLLEAANRLGFDCDMVPHGNNLYGTLVRLANTDGIYIVSVSNHFVAIEVNDKKIFFCDNHTKEPMPAAASARLLQRVLDVHRVTKRREPIEVSSMIDYTVERRDGEGPVLRIIQRVTYDIEKYNRDVQIARIAFNETYDFNRFVSELANEVD